MKSVLLNSWQRLKETAQLAVCTVAVMAALSSRADAQAQFAKTNDFKNNTETVTGQKQIAEWRDMFDIRVEDPEMRKIFIAEIDSFASTNAGKRILTKVRENIDNDKYFDESFPKPRKITLTHNNNEGCQFLLDKDCPSGKIDSINLNINTEMLRYVGYESFGVTIPNSIGAVFAHEAAHGTYKKAFEKDYMAEYNSHSEKIAELKGAIFEKDTAFYGLRIAEDQKEIIINNLIRGKVDKEHYASSFYKTLELSQFIKNKEDLVSKNPETHKLFKGYKKETIGAMSIIMKNENYTVSLANEYLVEKGLPPRSGYDHDFKILAVPLDKVMTDNGVMNFIKDRNNLNNINFNRSKKFTTQNKN